MKKWKRLKKVQNQNQNKKQQKEEEEEKDEKITDTSFISFMRKRS